MNFKTKNYLSLLNITISLAIKIKLRMSFSNTHLYKVNYEKKNWPSPIFRNNEISLIFIMTHTKIKIK